MNWGLALGGLGALAGGAGALFGAKKQADAYSQAAAQSAALSREAMALQEPWRLAGIGALPIVQGEVGSGFQQSPGYQWLLDQTLRATDHGASAAGLYGSGARAKALQQNAAGLAAQDYANWYNRLAGLAGVGQTAATTGGAALSGAIPSIAQSTAGAGSAMGAGYAGLGNALQGAGNNFLTLYALGKL